MLSPELDRALKASGQPNLRAWADQYPTLSMVALAGRLSEPVAPVTIALALADEAHRAGAFTAFARAWMVRQLHGDTSWLFIFDEAHKEAREALWKKAEAERAKDPSWKPANADDPRLVAIFAGVDLTRSARTRALMQAFERISAASADATTNEGVLRALAPLPPGFGFLHAVSWVNGEVLNGGFSQLFTNTGGLEVPLAIEGLEAMGRSDIADLVREALSFAHRYQPEVVNEAVRLRPPIEHPRAWPTLEKAYLARPQGLTEAFTAFVESRPELFEPPFHQLHHPDGRKWRIRANGAVLEIEIVLEDGSVVSRNRKIGSTAAADKEMKGLIDEQLADGFVRS